MALCALACCAVCFTEAAAAQRAASVSGFVYTLAADRVQTAWPNARITLKNVVADASYATVTNFTGEFFFSEILPGTYELTVTLEGFEVEQRQVELAPGASQRVEIRLQPRGVRETVRVGGTAPAEPDPLGKSPDGLPQNVLKSVPLLEDQFQDALPLVPGVVRGPDGLLNLRGARSTQSGTLVNTTSVVDPVTGQSAISLPLEAVDSVRVLSNPYSAEYGRFTGAVVEVDTRSGTDRWRFGVDNFLPRFRFRNGGFRGIRAFTPRFVFSGPLEKGKAYLFQALDYRYAQTRIESRPFLPEGQDETGLEAFDSFTRLDVNLNASNRLSGMFVYYPQNLTHVNLNTFNPQAVTPNFRQRGFFAAVSERMIFSGGGFLDSSFSVKRFDAHVFPSTPGPNLAQGLFLFPDQNFGAWYSTQDRESFLYQAGQDLHLRPLQGAGTHLVQFGYDFARSQYDGTVSNLPVTVLRNDGTTSQQITYSAGGVLEQAKNDFAGYVHDRWQIHPRLALDAGLRLDREDVSGADFNIAPRAAITVLPTRDNRTVLRVGAGIYYDKVPLYLRTFTDYPQQTFTRFAADGLTVMDGPKTFAHVITSADGELHVPFSVVWTVQLDRELTPRLQLRLSYEQRDTFDDFVVEPFESVVPAVAEFRLRNNGGQGYREFLAMVRWHATERTSMVFSYVRSRASGDLNSFDQFFGNYPTAIIRPNERNRLPFDVPDRILIWGTVGLPWKLELAPVVDWHSGFPFSAVDDDLNFVGQRNQAGRFPTFFSVDFQLARRFSIPFAGRRWDTLLGIRFFNVTNHFNPRDVQQVVAHPQFGQFFNTVDRKIRAKFEIQF